MYQYQCPSCDCLPVRYRKKPALQPQCMRCSRRLVKMSKVPNGYRWALAMAGLGMTLLTVPDLIEHTQPEFARPLSLKEIRGSLLPEEGVLRKASSLDGKDLMAQLEVADQQWEPKEEILPDGSTRYLYKRRSGEKDLSLPELRRMVETPPTFDQERQQILQLLSTLKQAGVQVLLEPTLKEGAAAEWDHKLGKLRIQPSLMQKGSVDFLRVLNHEAVHVAQSCRGGHLKAKPVTLGLNPYSDTSVREKLKDPIYADASQREKSLEKEAYAAQHKTERVRALVASECNLAVNMAN
jgi:hypothetical protein